jgi:hypothetical protein
MDRGSLVTRRPGPISRSPVHTSRPSPHRAPHLLHRRRRRRPLNTTPVSSHPAQGPLAAACLCWSPQMDGEEENVGPFRRTSARTRRMASRMASALASSDNRAQVTRRMESVLLLLPSSIPSCFPPVYQ